MKIALLGTGLMGYPMSEKLVEAGYETVVYNRTREKAEPLREIGVEIAETPAEAVSAAEAAILMLADGPAIEETLFSARQRVDFQDKTIIQMGTILPAESRDYRKRVQEEGGSYFEAPVLGSIPNVKEKSLLIIVGGPQEQFRQWEKLLRSFGSNLYWMGEVGKAAAAKLALNQLIMSLTAGFSLSLGLVREHEVDVEDFMAIVRQSALYAPTFDKKLDRYMARNFQDPHFPVRMLLKDLNLITSEAREQGLGIELLEALRSYLNRAIEIGEADSDYSALYNAIHPER